VTGRAPARHHCLAVCAPGLEHLAAAELSAQGVDIRRTLRGGVEFSATDRQLYAANLWCRTITRIVVRLARFRAASFGELERQVEAVAFGPWLPEGTTPSVRVSCTASHLYHSGAVAERLLAMLATGPDPGPLVVVRIVHDRLTISVDSSGEPLHRRGWRREPAKAPLRETLAAALVLASGWDGRAPFVDPFCGSGTIAIEAALLAAGRPPGEGRRFAFMDWPCFAPGTWASVVGAARGVTAATPSTGRGEIVAADRDAGAVAAAIANAERAGVPDRVSVHRASLSEATAPPGGDGWIVTNPPYGKRLAGGDLRDLFARFGAVVEDRFPAWTVVVLSADERVASHSRLRFEELFRTENGGLPVRALVRRGPNQARPARAPEGAGRPALAPVPGRSRSGS